MSSADAEFNELHPRSRDTGRFVDADRNAGDTDLDHRPYNPLQPDDYRNPYREDGVWGKYDMDKVPTEWTFGDHLKAVDSDPEHGGERILDTRTTEGMLRYEKIRGRAKNRARNALMWYFSKSEAEEAADNLIVTREIQARRRAATCPNIAFTEDYLAVALGAKKSVPLQLERVLHSELGINVAWLRVGKTYQAMKTQWLAEHKEYKAVPDRVRDELWDRNARTSYDAAVQRAYEKHPELYAGGRVPSPRMVVPLSDGRSVNPANPNQVFAGRIVTKVMKDDKGNTVYETGADGKVLTDAKGNRIPVIETKHSATFGPRDNLSTPLNGRQYYEMMMSTLLTPAKDLQDQLDTSRI